MDYKGEVVKDSLSTWQPTGSGLFLKFKSGEPVTVRVLTLDPVVAKDQWGGTRYAFVVWNWNENKAQILNKGHGFLKQFVAIHTDEDFGALNEVDVKITSSGEGLETRYNIVPLPKARELTSDMQREADLIDLDEKIEGGVRLSEVNEGDTDNLTGYEKAKATANKIKGQTDEFSDADIPPEFS